MDTSPTIYYAGVKGGVGTTTHALTAALVLAHDMPVRFVTDELDECLAWFGADVIAAVPDGITLVDTATGNFDGVTIVDEGVAQADMRDVEHRVLVTDTSYAAMRRYRNIAQRRHSDALIVVAHTGTALDAHDVADVTGHHNVVPSLWSLAVCRALDAGLMVSRAPADLTEVAERVAGAITQGVC